METEGATLSLPLADHLYGLTDDEMAISDNEHAKDVEDIDIDIDVFSASGAADADGNVDMGDFAEMDDNDDIMLDGDDGETDMHDHFDSGLANSGTDQLERQQPAVEDIDIILGEGVSDPHHDSTPTGHPQDVPQEPVLEAQQSTSPVHTDVQPDTSQEVNQQSHTEAQQHESQPTPTEQPDVTPQVKADPPEGMNIPEVHNDPLPETEGHDNEDTWSENTSATLGNEDVPANDIDAAATSGEQEPNSWRELLENEEAANTEPPYEDAEQLEDSDLHPVVVSYDSMQVCLFPPRSFESGDVGSPLRDLPTEFFLGNTSICNKGLDQLFCCLRELLQESDNVELLIECEQLGLKIGEDNKHCQMLTFIQILDVYLQLSHQDGIDKPGPFRMSLETAPRCWKRLEYLTKASGEGKGISAVDRRGSRQQSQSHENTEAEQQNTEEHASLAGKSMHDETSNLVQASGDINRDTQESGEYGEGSADVRSGERHDPEQGLENSAGETKVQDTTEENETNTAIKKPNTKQYVDQEHEHALQEGIEGAHSSAAAVDHVEVPLEPIKPSEATTAPSAPSVDEFGDDDDDIIAYDDDDEDLAPKSQVHSPSTQKHEEDNAKETSPSDPVSQSAPANLSDVREDKDVRDSAQFSSEEHFAGDDETKPSSIPVFGGDEGERDEFSYPYNEYNEDQQDQFNEDTVPEGVESYADEYASYQKVETSVEQAKDIQAEIETPVEAVPPITDTVRHEVVTEALSTDVGFPPVEEFTGETYDENQGNEDDLLEGDFDEFDEPSGVTVDPPAGESIEYTTDAVDVTATFSEHVEEEEELFDYDEEPEEAQQAAASPAVSQKRMRENDEDVDGSDDDENQVKRLRSE